MINYALSNLCNSISFPTGLLNSPNLESSSSTHEFNFARVEFILSQTISLSLLEFDQKQTNRFETSRMIFYRIYVFHVIAHEQGLDLKHFQGGAQLMFSQISKKS